MTKALLFVPGSVPGASFVSADRDGAGGARPVVRGRAAIGSRADRLCQRRSGGCWRESVPPAPSSGSPRRAMAPRPWLPAVWPGVPCLVIAGGMDVAALSGDRLRRGEGRLAPASSRAGCSRRPPSSGRSARQRARRSPTGPGRAPSRWSRRRSIPAGSGHRRRPPASGWWSRRVPRYPPSPSPRRGSIGWCVPPPPCPACRS